jgi:hypothetical protein
MAGSSAEAEAFGAKVKVTWPDRSRGAGALKVRPKLGCSSDSALAAKPVIVTPDEDTTASVWAFEVPPPGEGLKTVTAALPALAISVAGIEAVSWLPLAKVVGRLDPFQRTTDDEMKLLPLTVSIKAGPPAVTDEGLMPVMAGTGFEAVIVNAIEFDAPPPGDGLKTVIVALPALAMSLAGIEAVS